MQRRLRFEIDRLKRLIGESNYSFKQFTESQSSQDYEKYLLAYGLAKKSRETAENMKREIKAAKNELKLVKYIKTKIAAELQSYKAKEDESSESSSGSGE